MDEGRHDGFFRKESGAHYRLPRFRFGSDMGFAHPISTASDGEMVQGGMGAAGQHKGPHHEKHQTRTRRRILGPKHVDLPLLDFVLLWFLSGHKNKTRPFENDTIC
jgi:hypothetical protein